MRFEFGDYLLDEPRRELWRGVQSIAIEPQVFDLLLYFIQQRERMVSREDLIAAVWRGRSVSDSTIASRIDAARRAIGDDGVNQRYIRTAPRRGIRFVGKVQQSGTSAIPNFALSRFPDGASGPPQELGLHEEITFCRSADGVHLAVATSAKDRPS